MASANDCAQDFPDIAEVYERFAALTAVSPELGGSLLLYVRLDQSGMALAIAANIAGAASLGLEPELARAKASIRAGACDFLVNTLDETLRILKNEIRKKKPVSVALVGDVQAAISEMVERGVQPEIVEGTAPGIDALIARGARRLGWGGGPGEGVSWSVEREPLRWLPLVDRLAAEALDPDKTTTARRRWLEAAPRYLGRVLARERYVRMSTAEADAFVKALYQAGGVGVVVSVSRRSGSQTRAL